MPEQAEAGSRKPEAQKPTLLLVPGLWNSGPEHWQSHWERAGRGRRVVQRDWEHPRRAEWVETLDRAVAEEPGPVLLAAHSLGCALVAHWAAAASPAARAKIRGALLAAPSDVEAPSYPAGTEGFLPMPLAPLPFPGVVVISSDDEYVSVERARHFASAWGCLELHAGPLGHINSGSKLGMWPLGEQLLAGLARG